ncbi:MAG: type ISP restriction/modification enzyme, partial [Candidatus Binatia bacterium]
QFTRNELWTILNRFVALDPEAARRMFQLGKDGDWSVASAKADIMESGPSKRYITQILYRPFDIRYTYWTGRTKGFLARPRRDVMRHVVGTHNFGLIFNRQIVGKTISHFGVSRLPICHGTFYLGNKGQDYFAPLFTLPGDDSLLRSEEKLRENFTYEFRTLFTALIGEDTRDITPNSILSYIYAVFHSPSYRSRYLGLLKLDFPRVPLTGTLELFLALSRLGDQLVSLHLLGSPRLDTPISTFIGPANPKVGRVSYVSETVWLDGEQTRGFRGVPEEVWNFHIGGYQVCQKWLKDRKGRTLTADDITHYHRIVIALHETIRIMREIDEVIEAHGGWPHAFSTSGPQQAAAG